jgi:uroporphyrin-III C-methyltransferase / precorrin-2 dehydrogenase / sirohydrochlorin ferrochelatase
MSVRNVRPETDNQPAQATHMQPLARLPLFFALVDRRVVVTGGTRAAAWKAELLSAAGAAVDVFAPVACDELRDLAGRPPRGPVTIHARNLRITDLDGATLVVGACDNDHEAAELRAHACAAGVPVNVIDKPEFCDFSFGAIVNRSPLVIGIATDGAAPVFAQTIRARLEALIPAGFARWAAAAGRFRPRLQALGLSFHDRRRFWERFADAALSHPERAPDMTDFDTWLAVTTPNEADGTLATIAVTSHDPELLTLRAVRALQSADVIVADAGISPAVLDSARREAKKISLNAVRGRAKEPADIDAQLIALVAEGKRVVRLVAGEAAPQSARSLQTVTPAQTNNPRGGPRGFTMQRAKSSVRGNQ